MLNIGWGYDEGEDHAHVSTNISPFPEDTTQYPFEVFFTYDVVHISDPRDGSVLFEVKGPDHGPTGSPFRR